MCRLAPTGLRLIRGIAFTASAIAFLLIRLKLLFEFEEGSVVLIAALEFFWCPVKNYAAVFQEQHAVHVRYPLEVMGD